MLSNYPYIFLMMPGHDPPFWSDEIEFVDPQYCGYWEWMLPDKLFFHSDVEVFTGVR